LYLHSHTRAFPFLEHAARDSSVTLHPHGARVSDLIGQGHFQLNYGAFWDAFTQRKKCAVGAHVFRHGDSFASFRILVPSDSYGQVKIVSSGATAFGEWQDRSSSKGLEEPRFPLTYGRLTRLASQPSLGSHPQITTSRENLRGLNHCGDGRK
jgi:hypothetical protein